MKNTLLMLNYQREIPPFMLTELKYAAKSFDEVIYVTREFTNDNSDLLEDKNIHIVQIKKSDRIRSLLKMPFLFLRKEIRDEKQNGKKRRCLPAKYFFHTGKELYCSQNIYHAADSWVRKYVAGTNVVVQSTWFSDTAYAVSRLKKKYPNITAVSLAHSFEIDPKKSGFVGLSLDNYKIKMLDQISYIAKGMLEIYEKALPDWVSFDKAKMRIRYLGSVRLFPLYAGEETKAFTLCSCSGMVEVKRIELIIDALSGVKDFKIRWVHLGGGPLMDELTAMAADKLASKENIEYEFVGQLKNRDVQKYYSEHHIDLFVNVSASEGLPVSIMEAMSYGIPVIATDVGATREIVCYEENLLMPEDVTGEAIRDKILAFAQLPPEKRRDLRQKSIEIWETTFNAEKTAPIYYDSLKIR